MQSAGWISLLRRIPEEQHNTIVLMTTNGTEIVIQRLIRLDADFLVILGRLSGSTEQGKYLVIPYDQLTYLALSKHLTEAEIEATLSIQKSEIAAEKPAEPPPPREPKAVNLAPVPQIAGNPPDPANADKVAGKSEPKASPPSKALLLARLRQRLADGATKLTGS